MKLISATDDVANFARLTVVSRWWFLITTGRIATIVARLSLGRGLP